ncbi:uncharacterized protein IAS62_003010 [Cryptococcus decagattii]|uniref:3-hydroxybutyryl-CoA dehydrogenase n=1 Tax=Cryptococcus decagattii TaxID=1859122 RepID=A0ABZ2ATA8_9TREE
MTAIQSFRKAAIIGAGQMGLGIAYVTAVHARVPLTLHDPSSAVLSHAMSRVQSLLSKDVSKNRMTQGEADEALARINPVKGDGSGLNGDEKLKDVDIVIEAIPEIPELKLGLFKRLGDLLPPTSILGSNTSSISLTKLAASAGSMGGAQGKSSAERVIGIHYFNPVPVIACKKEVTLSADSPGFIANAILMPMLNEAIMILEKGIASTEHIDTTFRLGMGHPMGPLALADLIGLDTCLSIQRVLHSETGDSKYRPAGLLVRMVDAGWLGKKTGKGFYEYTD